MMKMVLWILSSGIQPYILANEVNPSRGKKDRLGALKQKYFMSCLWIVMLLS